MKYSRWLLKGAFLGACFFMSFNLYGQEGGFLFNTASSPGLFGGRVEAGAGIYYPFTQWKTIQDVTVLKQSVAINGYAGIWLTRWLLVGGEISSLLGKSQESSFQNISQREVGGMIKINFTPDTVPSQYLILGVGKRDWSYDLALSGGKSGSLQYYRAVFGLEFPLWKTLLLSVQWRLSYFTETDLKPYLHLSSRWENAPAAALSFQF